MSTHFFWMTVSLVMFLATSGADAADFRVEIDTGPIEGQAGFVVFDFIGGTPVMGNLATVSNAATDATLGVGTAAGAVSGTLIPGPLLFSDAQFFNEWLQGVTFGSALAFDLRLTTNTDPSGIPDAFSVFLLDTTGTVFPTADVTGANALFFIDVDSMNPLPVAFASDFAGATITRTPEAVPGGQTLWLMMLGVGLITLVHRRRIRV